MQRISKLTEEQEVQIPLYIEKWVQKASDPVNHKIAVDTIRQIYKNLNQNPPLIVFGQSPLNTILLCKLFFLLIKNEKLVTQLDNQLDNQLHNQPYNQIDTQLDTQLYSQIDSQLRTQLNTQLHDQLDSQLRTQLDTQLYSQLYTQIHTQLDTQIYARLYNQLRTHLHNQLDDQIDTQLDNKYYRNIYFGRMAWGGFYEYYKFIGVKFDEDAYELFTNFASEVTFSIPFTNIIFVSEKPTQIYWKNNILHNESGRAVRYADNYGLWCLNGVSVPEWLVTTPAEKINPILAIDEKNADIQREIIRKIGAERMLLALNAKEEDLYTDVTGMIYKLMTMKIGNIDRKYLYFEHASMPGVFYAKPVPPDCRKALHARAWMLSLLDTNKLINISEEKEEQIRANLPLIVS